MIAFFEYFNCVELIEGIKKCKSRRFCSARPTNSSLFDVTSTALVIIYEISIIGFTFVMEYLSQNTSIIRSLVQASSMVVSL